MIKLNIQRFSSTNKTTHYELSQYVSSDLPTYLVDYNSDMSKIDTGINTAKTTADTASTAATNAQTTAENAQTTANTAVTNAAAAQTSANGALTNIGTLANLDTAVKTSTVAAINEVVGNVGNKANLETTVKTDLVSAINELANDLTYDNDNVIHITDNTPVNTSGFTVTNVSLHFVKSLNEKTVKLYGWFQYSNATQYTGNSCDWNIDTDLDISNDIVVTGTVIPLQFAYGPTITFKTNGKIGLNFTPNQTSGDMYFVNTEIILQDFGHIVQ
jgi:hypothetical protein